MSNSLHRRHKQTLVVMLKLLVVMGLNWISEVRSRVGKKLFFLNRPSFFSSMMQLQAVAENCELLLPVPSTI
jgi:hypothetical protein